MNRISALPVTEYCGQAGLLGEQHGAGRAAAMSTAFHAQCAGDFDAVNAVGLTPDERDEIRGWHPPVPLDLGDAGVHPWDSFERELAGGLTAELAFCPYDDPDAITRGTMDGAKAIEIGGRMVAVVQDIKKSRFTSELDTLQLAGYGFMFASLRNCDAMSLGLWIAEDGRGIWGDTIDIYSLEAAELAQRVVHAATNRGPYATGSHCQRCYSRLYCPEFLMPPEMSETSLAPFTESLEGVAPDVLVDVLFKAQRAKQTAERVLDLCKDASLRLGGIPDGKGKAWRAQEQQGRESVAVGELRKQLGPEAEKFIKRGAPFSVARWVKA